MKLCSIYAENVVNVEYLSTSTLMNALMMGPYFSYWLAMPCGLSLAFVAMAINPSFAMAKFIVAYFPVIVTPFLIVWFTDWFGFDTCVEIKEQDLLDYLIKRNDTLYATTIVALVIAASSIPIINKYFHNSLV
jgi:hypothetical protein